MSGSWFHIPPYEKSNSPNVPSTGHTGGTPGPYNPSPILHSCPLCHPILHLQTSESPVLHLRTQIRYPPFLIPCRRALATPTSRRTQPLHFPLIQSPHSPLSVLLSLLDKKKRTTSVASWFGDGGTPLWWLGPKRIKGRLWWDYDDDVWQ